MSSFASLRSSLRLASTAPAMATRPFSSSASRSIARMIITGRLGSEPELQATASGQEMIRYSVATSNSRDKQQTSWFRVAGFLPEGPYRDLILSLPKGTLVCVDADASMRQFEDQDGRKQSQISIVQRNLEVLKRGNSGEESQ